MPRFLVLDLWGPLCSWGTVAVGDIRPGQAYPTRSALMGLVAGSLGLKRGDKQKQRALAESVGVGVMVRRAGRPLRDFHTVEVPQRRRGARYATRAEELAAVRENDNPIVSRRDYRADAGYSVALWRREKSSGPRLAELAEALDRPVFSPYLGRKACPPGLPLFPRLVEAATMLEAFLVAEGRAPLLASGLSWPPGKELFWDADLPASAVGCAPDGVNHRRDQPVDRLKWIFAERPEAWAALPEKGE